jgi:hypothetical protein
MKRQTIVAALLGVSLILGGCITEFSPPAIPAPIAETIPKPPVSPTPLIWQPGHWDWTNSAYVWIPGQYVSSAGHGNLWMAGFWEKTPSGWVWHLAHWV